MRARLVALGLVIISAFAGAYYWHMHRATEGERADSAAFTLVGAMERALDGQPALALTFSQPVDPRKSYDKLIDVFEMPPRTDEPRPGARSTEQSDETKADKSPFAVSTDTKDTDIAGGNAVKHAWVVGSNPRLIYFPHVKPETRYVVAVKAGLLLAAGASLLSFT